MEKKGSDLQPQSLCAKGGERCDLHFLVENEVIQTKSRVDKLENRTTQSFDNLNKSLNDLIVEMRTYVGSQEFRDNAQKEMKTLTLSNTKDINDLKSSLKSLEEHEKITNATNERTNKLLENLSQDLKALDKMVLSKSDVAEMVTAAIIADKNSKSEKWFDSLPAKVAAGAAVISFISFFTIKIVILLLSI